MAMSTTNKIAISIFVTALLLALVIDDTDARRGGGGRGGGGRGRGGGRTKTRGGGGGSTTRAKNYNNVALSGRILKGSSPYNRNTWRAAATGGLIFVGAAYLMRPRHHPRYNEMPIICTNRNFEREGKRYDHFICPLPDTNDTLKYCCGPERGEYCCDKATAQKYYAEHHSYGSSPVGMIIGLIVLVLVICGIVYCCKKSGGGPLIKMFKSKRGEREQSGMTLSTTKHTVPSDFEHPHASVPLNPPSSNDGSYPPGAPEYPPPYNASSAAFDGSSGLPYAPPPAPGFAGPAPYPPTGAPPYPPGDPAPYPPAPYPPAGAPPYPPYPSGPVPPYPGAAPPATAPPYNTSAAYPAYGPGNTSKI